MKIDNNEIKSRSTKTEYYVLNECRKIRTEKFESWKLIQQML